jgi:hypothetical protein
MRPEPQGHKPAIAWNSMVLPLPDSPTMSTRSPGRISTCRSLSVVQPLGVAIYRFSKVILPPIASTNSMRFSVAPSPSIVITASRKLAMRNRVARQSAMGAEIIDEPPQGLLHLNEGADDHHQPAEARSPPKYPGDATAIGAIIVNQP